MDTFLLDNILQDSYKLGMIQNQSEIIKACLFFHSLKVENFIEIGTDKGGTFALWSKLSGDGLKISVDLPHAEFGTNFNLQERNLFLSKLGNNVHLIQGSSHENSTQKKVDEILQGKKVDFLFIDGDHTYLGAKCDYLMYKDFVRPGGWIAFHDIKDTEYHRSVNCRVDQLWSELEGNKIEFIEPSTKFGGIGFIQNN